MGRDAEESCLLSNRSRIRLGGQVRTTEKAIASLVQAWMDRGGCQETSERMVVGTYTVPDLIIINNYH